MASLRVLASIALFCIAMPASAQTRDAWHPFVAEASARFGIPEGWIERVIRAESGGRTTIDGVPIRSRVGAIGLMQLMPRTWQAMRDVYRLGPDPDDPHDNILAGTAYLRQMYDMFGYPGLFGGYNAGPARYAAYLLHRTRLPAETIAYVTRIAPTLPPQRTRAQAASLFFAIDPPSTGVTATLRFPATLSATPVMISNEGAASPVRAGRRTSAGAMFAIER